MTKNLPTLTEVAGNPAILSGLSLDALDALMAEATDQGGIVGAVKKAITAHIEAAYAASISAAYSAQDKDFGTVRIPDGGYEIVIDTPKKVEWDQAALAEVRSRIEFSGDDPSEYIKTTLTVDERAYSAWPAMIRKTFEAARSVKPGARSVKLVRKEAA